MPARRDTITYRPAVENKPRVVHLVESLEIGGRESLISGMAVARGSSSTTVICMHKIGVLGEMLRSKGFRVDLADLDLEGQRWLGGLPSHK